MRATTKPTKTAAKRADRGVSFEEMRRLMQVYGSIKCLRKRQTPGGEEYTKVDSVKRKFYRWFPDLDERFAKDEDGYYRPKLGHEFEVRYREQMRMKDGEILAKKRATCRKQRRCGVRAKAEGASKAKPTTFTPSTVPNCARVSPVIADEICSSLAFPIHSVEGYDGLVAASTAIDEDTEPLDRSFIAERGIFDDVEQSFYGANFRDRPSLELSFCSPSSSSSSEDGDGSSWDSDSPSIEDMLDKSIEECCDEVWGSDSSSVSGHLLDMISV